MGRYIKMQTKDRSMSLSFNFLLFQHGGVCKQSARLPGGATDSKKKKRWGRKGKK
jgi:hypothetical protein